MIVNSYGILNFRNTVTILDGSVVRETNNAIETNDNVLNENVIEARRISA